MVHACIISRGDVSLRSCIVCANPRSNLRDPGEIRNTNSEGTFQSFSASMNSNVTKCLTPNFEDMPDRTDPFRMQRPARTVHRINYCCPVGMNCVGFEKGVCVRKTNGQNPKHACMQKEGENGRWVGCACMCFHHFVYLHWARLVHPCPLR